MATEKKSKKKTATNPDNWYLITIGSKGPFPGYQLSTFYLNTGNLTDKLVREEAMKRGIQPNMIVSMSDVPSDFREWDFDEVEDHVTR